jgi:hypothetical protein
VPCNVYDPPPLIASGASDLLRAIPDWVLDLRPLKSCRYFSDSPQRNMFETRDKAFDTQAVTPRNPSDTPV